MIGIIIETCLFYLSKKYFSLLRYHNIENKMINFIYDILSKNCEELKQQRNW